MSKRDKFWEKLPRHPDDTIAWPDDLEGRRDVARDIVGARIIGAVEAALETRLQVVAGNEDDGSEDAARGEIFAAMNREQKAAVEGLLRSLCFGSLYWLLVKLRDCPDLEVDIAATSYSQGQALEQLGLNETELYDLYHDWVEKFSDHQTQE